MPDVWLEQWSEALEAFPLAGSADEQLRALVGYAVLAPSSHNSQPWRFRIADGRVELLADPSRALPVVDPDGRELIISCGAALFHLRAAAHFFGRACRIQRLPDATRPELLAILSLTGSYSRTPTDEALFVAMPRRHTCRRSFDGQPVEAAVVQSLIRAARKEGARFDVLAREAVRAELTDLVMEGDRIQLADSAFRRELAVWMRPNGSGEGDGMPGSALALGPVAARLAPLVIRTFDVGRGRAAQSSELAAHSPLLAVLSTPGDTPLDWLAAGEALSRVLLLACDAGLQSSYLNQAVEVPRLRRRLAAVVPPNGWPQIVLRLGRATAAPATPRRPLEEVVY